MCVGDDGCCSSTDIGRWAHPQTRTEKKKLEHERWGCVLGRMRVIERKSTFFHFSSLSTGEILNGNSDRTKMRACKVGFFVYFIMKRKFDMNKFRNKPLCECRWCR